MAKKPDKNKIELTLVVNGQPVTVEANENAPLQTAVNKALEDSENVGQPPENWELRDEAGNLLDLTQKIGTFGFSGGAVLMLSLKAGIAG